MMGIVNDDDLLIELDKLSPSTIKPKVEIKSIPNPGRNGGDKNVPDSLRKIIGETNQIDGRPQALAIAKDFGISDSSVSAYANGTTSTASYDEPKKEIESHIQRSKDRISSKARSLLLKSLKNITEEKLASAKVEVLSGVAKDMSNIIKNTEPDHKNPVREGPQFIIYAPQFVPESKFETIILNE